MTSEELVPATERGAILKGMKDAFRKEAEPSILTEEMVTAPLEATTSTGDPGDVQRTQLSFIRAAIEGAEEKTADELLARAGMNPEMFLQMTSRPDFMETYKGLIGQVIYVQRLPRIINAMSVASEAGDPRAWKQLDEYFQRQVGDGYEEFRAAIIHGDQRSALRIVDGMLSDLEALRATLVSASGDRSKAKAMIVDENTKAVESLK